MLKTEYLAERIAYHREIVEAHVLGHHRSIEIGANENAERSLQTAATHAAIFTALSSIAASKK